ncbi:MAG: hypothetical protein RAK18_02375, partial [Conexivisphaerales archaeon]|nr:hypothetical protein [Conexivisphaerales archaeon]
EVFLGGHLLLEAPYVILGGQVLERGRSSPSYRRLYRDALIFPLDDLRLLIEQPLDDPLDLLHGILEASVIY